MKPKYIIAQFDTLEWFTQFRTEQEEPSKQWSAAPDSAQYYEELDDAVLVLGAITKRRDCAYYIFKQEEA